jgi:hypothetical protein
MFETLNNIDILLPALVTSPALKFIYGLAGSDAIASKSSLAYNLIKQYGIAASGTMMPVTFIIDNDAIDSERELEMFNAQYDPNKMYILKKNIQRQEGVKLTSDKAEILDVFKNPSGYVVCQELLQDPLLVGGRKVNIRIYMLIVSRPGGITNIYTYKDGFMYYTPEMFRAGYYSTATNITTGYIDRQVYVDNPLTYQDLLTHLGVNGASLLDQNINRLLGRVANAYTPLFKAANETTKSDAIRFLIYGCDIAPDQALGAKIMEVNKGPDLSYKDERDKTLKLGMFKEALEIAGVIVRDSTSSHRFKKHT